MNYLDFFASVISSITSLAWPAAVVTAVWLFRGEIRPLLPRLHLKHKDTELSFQRRLEDAEIVVESLPAPPQDTAPATPEELSRFEQLVAISPRTALLEIRREAEEAVSRAGKRAGYTTSFSGARGTMRLLRRNMIIDESTSKLLDDLFAIGNAAAHDPQAVISAGDARRYRAIADRLIETLENPPPPPPPAPGDY